MSLLGIGAGVEPLKASKSNSVLKVSVSLFVLAVILLLLRHVWLSGRNRSLSEENAPSEPTASQQKSLAADKQMLQAIADSDAKQDAEHIAETNRRVERYRTTPTPQSPVPLAQIQGVWWNEESPHQRKVYGFVEDLNMATKPYQVRLSTPSGAKLILQCMYNHPPTVKSRADYQQDFCDVLPIFTWVRLSISDAIVTPKAESWVATYRQTDTSPVSDFGINGVCYPNGDCITADEAGKQQLSEMAEKRRQGR